MKFRNSFAQLYRVAKLIERLPLTQEVQFGKDHSKWLHISEGSNEQTFSPEQFCFLVPLSLNLADWGVIGQGFKHFFFLSVLVNRPNLIIIVLYEWEIFPTTLSLAFRRWIYPGHLLLSWDILLLSCWKHWLKCANSCSWDHTAVVENVCFELIERVWYRLALLIVAIGRCEADFG